MATGHKFFKVTGSLSGLTRPDKLALRSWDITVPSTGDAKEFYSLDQLQVIHLH